MRRCATVDLTSACPLRCRHCYFFANLPAPRALDDDQWLARLGELVAREQLHTAFWVGGEPLLEPGLLTRGLALFARNAVATSGAVPIPPELDAGLLVSLDGLEPEHDALRGSGAFARALRHLAPLPAGRFILHLTLTRQTLKALGDLPELVERTRAAGAVVGFFTGPGDSPYALASDQRQRAIDRLHELGRDRPDVLLTPPAALELLRPGAPLRAGCPYLGADLALDARLERRQPCSFGASADCSACGCAVVAMRAAMDGGDAASRAKLGAVFQRYGQGQPARV